GIEGKAISRGPPYSREHGSTNYRFHPVLLTTEQQETTLSDEHDRSRWIAPGQVGDHATTTEEQAVERFQD
ncbi:MAG: hypothetical protein SVU32_03750, partial [Candidatus Nanohaloarchaea archaeon]|nr:hypothetical protein [Candidatus Nanohaloarchaea archaeon]